MEIKEHSIDEIKIAEIKSRKTFIISAGDAVDLLGTLYFQGFDRIIIHKNNLSSEFFDLKTGLAGEILQKFSNYRVRLAVVGDFSTFSSKSIKAFIYESNKGRQINFTNTRSQALKILSQV